MSFSHNLGRWLQEDPIGFEGGDTNLYRYIGNNPTTATDPSGLERMTNWLRKEAEEYHKQAQREYQRQWQEYLRRQELLKAGQVTEVEVPKSKDGSFGFCFRVEDFSVRDVKVGNIGPGTSPKYVQVLLGFVNIQRELEKQLQGKKSYEFHSLPPGYECDWNNKQVYDGKQIIVRLKDQKVYPVPGEDWYVTVTATIELDVGKGWIAPGKKKE